MNWLKAPSAEVAARALIDVSGPLGSDSFSRSIGLWVLHRAGKAGSRVWLAAWALRAVLARARRLDREARVPRPLSDRGRAGVRASRRSRGDGGRVPDFGRWSSSRPSSRRASASSLVLVRRCRATGAARTGGAPSRPCSRRGGKRCRSWSPRGRRTRRRRTTAPMSSTSRPRTPSGFSPGRRPATSFPEIGSSGAGLRRPPARRTAAVRMEGERTALAAATLRISSCGSGRACAARGARRTR